MVRIREAQLEYNETRSSERIAQEVELRVQARLANRPEPPPPALAPVFVSLSSRLTIGRSEPMPDEWVTSKHGWDRYLDEKLASLIKKLILKLNLLILQLLQCQSYPLFFKAHNN